MLALVLAVALSQCSKDTDCKGERICSEGVCVTPDATAPRVEPSAAPSAEAVAAQRLRIAKASRMESELRELHEELEDATLGGPIVKLAGATACAALGLVLFVSWDSNPRGTAATFWSAVGAGAVALGLYIWGGIQMRLRLNARQELPLRIAEKEAELALLRAGR